MTGKPKRTRLQLLIEVLAVITIVAAAFFIYTADYYHSDSSAADALVSDSRVTASSRTETWCSFRLRSLAEQVRQTSEKIISFISE